MYGRLGQRVATGLGIVVIGAAGGLALAAERPTVNLDGATVTAPGAAQSSTPPAMATSPQAVDSSDSIAPARVSMDFQDANIKDVLKVFSKETGLNLIAKEDIGSRTITLYLDDVSVLDALDQILRAADLTYDRPPGSEIFIVRTKPSRADQPTETRVYRLKFARVSTSRLARAVETLGTQTPYEAQQLTQQLGQLTGSGSGSSGSGSRAPAGVSGQAKDVGIDRVVRELLTPQGKLMVDERTNSLIVTDLSENFPRIEAVMNALDIKTMQVLIEAEVLETTLSRFKDLGVEWGSGTEGDLLKVTGATKTTRAPFSTLFGDKSGAATGITTGTIDASRMVAILQALERDTETKVLARPKVLTLENESAVIRLTSPQAVGVSSITVTQSGDIIKTPERMTTGIILVVTPEVNENGYITMLVEPSVTKTVPSEVDSAIIDPKTRSARAMVRVRSGHTLVLGGLIDRTEKDVVQRVPILSGIPFIGGAFKNTEKNDVSSELVVFVTPRVLSEPTGTRVAWQGNASSNAREQDSVPSRQDMIEQTLRRMQ